MSVILLRTTPHGTQYLTNLYTWAHMPSVFPDWQLPVVMRVMTDRRNKSQPTGIAFVGGGVIDLDKLEVIEL